EPRPVRAASLGDEPAAAVAHPVSGLGAAVRLLAAEALNALGEAQRREPRLLRLLLGGDGGVGLDELGSLLAAQVPQLRPGHRARTSRPAIRPSSSRTMTNASSGSRSSMRPGRPSATSSSISRSSISIRLLYSIRACTRPRPATIRPCAA